MRFIPWQQSYPEYLAAYGPPSESNEVMKNADPSLSPLIRLLKERKFMGYNVFVDTNIWIYGLIESEHGPDNVKREMRWNEVLGRKAFRDFDKDELIEI